MEYLNIIFGLGGTGLEVVHGFLKIKKRYQIIETNDIEWFVIDTANPEKQEQCDFSGLDDNIDDKLIQLETFNDANRAVETIKDLNSESNIEDIFPVDGMIREENDSNIEGSWVKRKLGYLSLLYHLVAARRNVIKKLDDLIAGKDKRNLETINFFFVASIAGGTGSGITLPLNILVKNLMDMDDKYKAYDVRYYHLLATPEAVNQGDKEPSKESIREHIYANAYQTLKEIDIISKATPSNSLKWQVKLTQGTKLEYNSSMGNLVNCVFLFNDTSYRGHGLAHNATNGKLKYKPIFHLISWSLFALNSITAGTFRNIGNYLNADRKKPFSGMGTYALEYPQNDILRNCAQILLQNLDNEDNLADFRNINEEEIKNKIKTFNLPVENFEELAKSAEKFGKISREYNRNINQYNNRAQIIELEPQITLPKTDEYASTFREKLNIYVENMLKNDKFTLLDLKKFLNKLQNKINKKKSNLETKVNRRERNIDDVKIRLKKARSIRAIRRIKINEGFSNKYYSKLYKAATDLVIKNKNYLSRLINYLNEIFKVFKFNNFKEDSKYCEKQDAYFKYLPLQRTYENLDETSSDIMRKIYDNFQEKHLQTHTNELREVELKQKILNDFWISSTNEFNELFADQIYDFVKKGQKNVSKKDLIKKYEENLIEYLRRKGNLGDWNNIMDKIKDGQLETGELQLEYAVSFINVKEIRGNNNSEKFIACSPQNFNNFQRIETSNLGDDFRRASTYRIIPHDNIVVFCGLAGKFSLETINTDEYKENYERKINRHEDKENEEKWYRFIDPCFEEFEERQ